MELFYNAGFLKYIYIRSENIFLCILTFKILDGRTRYLWQLTYYNIPSLSISTEDVNPNLQPFLMWRQF